MIDRTEQSSSNALDDLVPGRRKATGTGRAWKDVLIQVFERHPHQECLLIPAVPEPLVVWVLSGSARVEERELGGTWVAHSVAAGDFFLTHAATPYELRWQAEGSESFEVMHLHLGLPLLKRAAAEVLGSETAVELRDASGERDSTLSALLEPLRAELATAVAPSALLVQGVAQGLAVHLVRHYGAPLRTAARPRGGLPAFKLRRVIAMMDARLDRDFQLAPLARAAGLSAFHFGRAFKQSTGYPPSQFFIRLRVDRARQLLRETRHPIIDIALAVGYSSASRFAQVFRREVGVTPTAYRDGN